MLTTPFLNFPIRSTKLSMSAEVSEHLLNLKTPFQTIDIYDTPAFGKVLTLDGHIQLAELDEVAYHEALVQIPMLSIDKPRRALVIGGGDGGVLRELCRHKGLERIDMVEIDAEVIESSKRYLPKVSAGAFADHRVRVHVEDAFGFVHRIEDPYDFIVLDITDVYEDEDGALSEQLFTEKFHQDCRAALSEKGILVTQADNHIFCPYSLEEVQKTLADIFDTTGWYQALVPSFGGFSAYCWASNGVEVKREFPANSLPLEYLNPVIWALAFCQLPFQRD